MKSSNLCRCIAPVAMLAALLTGCGGGPASGIATTPTPQGPASGPSNSWTWAGGSNVAGAWGSYGVLGTGTVVTAPGARNAPVTWRDSSGALWLFGGLGYDSTGAGGSLDDLWKFSPSNSLWTWIGGSSVVNDPGAWGMQGIAASTNHPSARIASASWTDGSGNFWLYGGNGLAAGGSSGLLADLWEYSVASASWTWIAGPNTENVAAVYGARGVPDATSAPGARDAAVTWRDSAGNLWLFGGTGYDSTGTGGAMNDLWEFNPSTNQWTWIGGSTTANIAGQYGVIGAALSTNAPGARFSAVAWIDAAGKLWLFGGQGFDATGSNGSLNDLWTFDPGTGSWTWVGGSSIVGTPGIYGTQGTTAAGNVPGARGASVAWTDSSGKFWLFGGLGADSAATNGYLDDLWTYDPLSGQWTFMFGSTLANVAGNYGTLLSGSTSTIPGARFGAAGWIDSNNALWLFGGQGADASGAVSNLNDLWKYTR